ncbi:MAG: glycosyltransferase [Elusimicrobia bacterium]|nr:glycosyltransferase [Elusimicrobiota bacterium]
MRVLVVHNRYRVRAGEDSVVDEEMALLSGAGHEVIMHAPDSAHLERAGPLAQAAALARFVAASPVSAALEALLARRPGVVYAHNLFPGISPSLYARCRALGIPVVQVIHNSRLACPSAMLYRDGRYCEDCVGRSFAWPAVRHGCYHGSRPLSLVVAAAMRTQLDAARRDAALFMPVSELKAEVLKRSGIPPARIVIKLNPVADTPRRASPRGRSAVFLGRLVHEKGVLNILAAWAGDHRLGPIQFVGDGPCRDEVAAAARSDPRILPLGWLPRENIGAILAEARFLLCPSFTSEPSGMTVIEAWSVGLPAIVTGRPGASGLFGRGTGIEVPPGDPAALADAAAALWSDDAAWERMSAASRSRYERDHSPGAVLAVLERAFRQVGAR